MKINRIAEEKTAPEWVFDNEQASEYIDHKTLKAEEVNTILKMSSNISEDDIVMEKDKIEKCASSNSTYYYNTGWSPSVKAELKEYASVCKMNMSNFKAIEPSSLTSIASDSKMVKTASVAEAPRLVLSDPFKLDEKIASGFEKTKWVPELKDASKLADRPTMSGIIPVRGGEDYFANSESKVAMGQNSISNPKAIETLAESTVEDTGARLRRENKEKESSKKTRHEDWQKEKVEAMVGKEILPKRYIFPTECLNAQPGIKGEVFDYSKLPEKTAGEQIHGQNEDRRKAIRGEDKSKYEFAVAKNPTRSISEDFGSELAKHLK
jgi:hypothetical protein